MRPHPHGERSRPAVDDLRARMRIPGRAVAAAFVLTLTACGSVPDTTGANPVRAASLVIAARIEAHVGPTAQTSGSWPDRCPAPEIDCAGVWSTPTRADPVERDVDLDVVLGVAAFQVVDTNVADISELPRPRWWSGTCNVGSHPGSYPLGASFRGVQACGPQPGRFNDRLVRFFPGAWGEYEWQCTELAYRFMYLAYGVVPYAGNGDQVVDNYRPAYGGNLVKVTNGSGELPEPGDILSYNTVHTAVVTGVDVDADGNGTVSVLEQNAPNDGSAKLTVTRWRIANVKNWLHHPIG